MGRVKLVARALHFCSPTNEALYMGLVLLFHIDVRSTFW